MRFLLASLLFVTFLACSRDSENFQPEHRYTLSGKVVALDPQSRTATVDAAAIPNYMEAMTMEYPVKSKGDFSKLHVGDRIKATLEVAGDGRYDLSGIQIQSAGHR